MAKFAPNLENFCEPIFRLIKIVSRFFSHSKRFCIWICLGLLSKCLRQIFATFAEITDKISDFSIKIVSTFDFLPDRMLNEKLTKTKSCLRQCGQCIWFTGKLCELLTKSYFLRELFLAIKWKRNKKNVLGISYNMMWSKRINADYAYLGNSPVFSWLTMKNLRKLHHLNF